MGLSISYQIITEKYGGKLECFSQEWKSTEFMMRIPLCQSVPSFQGRLGKIYAIHRNFGLNEVKFG